MRHTDESTPRSSSTCSSLLGRHGYTEMQPAKRSSPRLPKLRSKLKSKHRRRNSHGRQTDKETNQSRKRLKSPKKVSVGPASTSSRSNLRDNKNIGVDNDQFDDDEDQYIEGITLKEESFPEKPVLSLSQLQSSSSSTASLRSMHLTSPERLRQIRVLDYSRFSQHVAQDQHDIEVQALSQALAQIRRAVFESVREADVKMEHALKNVKWRPPHLHPDDAEYIKLKSDGILDDAEKALGCNYMNESTLTAKLLEHKIYLEKINTEVFAISHYARRRAYFYGENTMFNFRFPPTNLDRGS